MADYKKLNRRELLEALILDGVQQPSKRPRSKPQVYEDDDDEGDDQQYQRH
jgi:hypothetical protein